MTFPMMAVDEFLRPFDSFFNERVNTILVRYVAVVATPFTMKPALDTNNRDSIMNAVACKFLAVN
jgi:hypothetical protein